MRENRPSGSEGGGTKPIVSSYPYPHSIVILTIALLSEASGRCARGTVIEGSAGLQNSTFSCNAVH